MRKVLKNFYYGNIIPGEKEMRPGSELHRAVNTAARCENQLAEGLDEVRLEFLTKLVKASMRSMASQRWRTSSWASGSALG